MIWAGGANHYRNRLIQDKIGDGFSALVLAFNIRTLSYKLIVKSERAEGHYKIPDEGFVFELLNYVKIQEIVYNTGVSFVNPETIPSFCSI